jgi:hypothetical protein
MTAVVFSLVLAAALTVNAAASPVYTNQGTISGIDLTHDTIVVEVPVKGKQMTVGGPLVQDAKLMKGNRAVDLEDFKEGEKVWIEWQYTDQGHRVHSIMKK